MHFLARARRRLHRTWLTLPSLTPGNSGRHRLTRADPADTGRNVGESSAVGWRAFKAELGYGLGLGGAPGVVTPYAGVSLADGGERRLRTGARWAIAERATLGLEATRREAANDEAAPEHGVMLRGSLRW